MYLYIKGAKQVILEEFESDSKNNFSQKEAQYWVHKVNQTVIKYIHKNKIIGAKKRLNKSINPGDKILLFTRINRRIRIFGYTVVEEHIYQSGELYDYYASKNKLRLKGVKYFNKPIIVSEIAEKLSFIKNPKKSASSFNSEWKQITKEDFKQMTFRVSLSSEFPSYLKEVSLPEDEFIFNTIKVICHILKSHENIKQIEIQRFISILEHVLNYYGFGKTYDEIYEFYTKNVYKLNLRHNPSRFPEKAVPLYTSSGAKRNFTYLSLE